MNLINGLYYIPNYLTNDEILKIEEYLLKSNEWFTLTKNPKSRKVIHFGYNYSYDRSGIKKIKDIPNFFSDLVTTEKINNKLGFELLKDKMDQLIINEYLPGQGISKHIDHIKYFGSIIICLTIGSPVNINFVEANNESNIKKIKVEIGSLYIMSGDSRYKWKHYIEQKKEDDGIKRMIRTSLTYRTINLPYSLNS